MTDTLREPTALTTMAMLRSTAAPAPKPTSNMSATGCLPAATRSNPSTAKHATLTRMNNVAVRPNAPKVALGIVRAGSLTSPPTRSRVCHPLKAQSEAVTAATNPQKLVVEAAPGDPAIEALFAAYSPATITATSEMTLSAESPVCTQPTVATRARLTVVRATMTAAANTCPAVIVIGPTCV